MAKKRRKKRRLRAPKIPAGLLIDEKFNEPCPKCESHSTSTTAISSRGQTYECRSCGHEWMNQAAQENAQREKEAADMTTKKKAAKKKPKPKPKAAKKAAKAKKQPGERDSRIPKVGTVLKAKYKGEEYIAKVTAEGFEFKGEQFKSISKVGSVIMGGKACNGYKLFSLC